MSKLLYTNILNKEKWEITYLKNLLDLKFIFLKYIKKINRKLWIELKDNIFLDNFSYFIFDCSSKYKTKYMEDFSPELEDWYYKYTLYRNKVYENNGFKDILL
jgi:hypothetical protein